MATKINGWNLFGKVAKAGAVHRSILYGKPGTGKTYNACKLATDKGEEYYSVTLNEESSVSEILGMWVPKGKEFVFQPGVAIRAWLEGKLLVINEIDKASGSVLTVLYAILDDKAIAGLTIPDNKGSFVNVKPAEGFRAIATMNGTLDDLPLALADRFDMRINITEPHPDAIALLPADLQQIARNAYSAKDTVVSMRDFIAFAKLREAVGSDDALAAVFGDKAAEMGAILKVGFRK